MKSFSIRKVGGDDQIKLDGYVIKEVPEEIREAVGHLTENGKESIETLLWKDGGFLLRIGGKAPSMPPEKYHEVIKNYLEGLRKT